MSVDSKTDLLQLYLPPPEESSKKKSSMPEKISQFSRKWPLVSYSQGNSPSLKSTSYETLPPDMHTPPSEGKTPLSSPFSETTSGKMRSKTLSLFGAPKKSLSTLPFLHRHSPEKGSVSPLQSRSQSCTPNTRELFLGNASGISSHSFDEEDELPTDSRNSSRQSYTGIHLSPLEGIKEDSINSQQGLQPRCNSSTKSLKRNTPSLNPLRPSSCSFGDKAKSFTPAFGFTSPPPYSSSRSDEEHLHVADYEAPPPRSITPPGRNLTSQFNTPPRELPHTIKKPTPKRPSQEYDEEPFHVADYEAPPPRSITPPARNLTSQFNTPPRELSHTIKKPTPIRRSQQYDSEGLPKSPPYNKSKEPLSLHDSPFRKMDLKESATPQNKSQNATDEEHPSSIEHAKPKFSSLLLNKIWNQLPGTLEDLLVTAKNAAALAAYGLAAANNPNTGGEIAGDSWDIVEGAMDTKESAEENERKKAAGSALQTAFNALNLGITSASLAKKKAPQIAETVAGIGGLSASTAILAPIELREQIKNREFGKAGGTLVSTVGDAITSMTDDIIPLVASNALIPGALVAAGPITVIAGGGILTIFRGLETREDELFHTECIEALQKEGIRKFLEKYIRLSQEERNKMGTTAAEVAAITKKRIFFAKRTSEDLLKETLDILNHPTRPITQDQWIDLASRIEAQSFENLVKGWIETSLAAMTTTAAALAIPSNGITALVAGGIVLAYVIGDGKNGYIVKKVASHCRPYTEMGKNGKDILMHMPIEKHIHGTPQRVGALRAIETDENGEPKLNAEGDIIFKSEPNTRKDPLQFPIIKSPSEGDSGNRVSILEQSNTNQHSFLPPKIGSSHRKSLLDPSDGLHLEDI